MNKNENLAIPQGWNQNNIADLTGKRFLVIGATSGLGLQAAKVLASKGADVTITARNSKKGERALNQSGASRYVELELTDLASVREVAKTINKEKTNYDVLILNAGVIATPYGATKDGFELQMGTNYLGHFALAGLIHNRINFRIVSVSSQAHRIGSFGSNSLDDIRERCFGVGKYSPWAAYGSSKLANLLFTAELERRRLANGWKFIPLAAHPGLTSTNLFKSSTESTFMKLFSQPLEVGTLPILAAATYPHLIGSSYIGPSRYFEMRGTPKLTRARALAYDQILGANLWQVSTELTGVTWDDSPHA